MKWIKTAIGAVIAVLSIGIIATTVFKMTQPREVTRAVSFEIDPEEGKYYPVSTYNKIVEYGVINQYKKVTNIVSIYVNNEIVDLNEFFLKLTIYSDHINFTNDIPNPLGGSTIIDSYIDAEGNWFNDGGELDYNVNIKLVFEVTQPPQLTGISATLILLIPLVFVGGVLLYFYKPLKKE